MALLVVPVSLLVILLVAGLAARQLSRAATAATPADPILVYTPGDAEQSAPHLSASIRNDLQAVALTDGSVTLLAAEGDGSSRIDDVDLTPRYGDEVDHIASRRTAAAIANVSSVDARPRGSAATVPGRSLLSGFQAAARLPNTGPIYAVSCGLDLLDPLNLRRLTWDTPPADVVAFLRRTDTLPHLGGRRVVLALLPVAGQQQRLGQPEQDALAALWRAILEAAGAQVSFAPTDTISPTATITVPTVAVPAPAVLPASSDRCTISATALFVFGTANLIERARALKELRPCATLAASGGYAVSVTGHTSQDAATGPSGGGPLSLARARAVRDLFINELGVPPRVISDVRGVGATQPLCSPPGAACNRAVVVQFHPVR